MIKTNIYIDEPDAKGYFTARNFVELEKIMTEKQLKSCEITMTLFREGVLSDNISIDEVKKLARMK